MNTRAQAAVTRFGLSLEDLAKKLIDKTGVLTASQCRRDAVPTWSKDFQKQVAAGLRAAATSALAKVAVLSIGDRDVVRACRSRK